MKSLGLTTIGELLVNEEDARVCKDISEEACRESPRNAALILAGQLLSKLGDAVMNPKIVLTWIMSGLGAPDYLTSFLVPVRESGSLVPQLVIAKRVRELEVRKRAWAVSCVLQATCVAAMGAVVMLLEGALAGWLILALLAAFALARGLSSVASKDVLGKTIAKTRRGRLTGWSASAAGGVTVAVAVLLLVFGDRSIPLEVYALALLAGAGMWLLSAALVAGIVEEPGETEGGGNALEEARRHLRLLRDDAPFRRFVIARALLMCTALSTPYLVILAHRAHGADSWVLGSFLLAGGVASLASGPVWGNLADVSSRIVMAIGGYAGAAGALVVAGLAAFAPDVLGVSLVLPLAFLVLSIAHSGVRVGRKTYVVDLAEGNRRTDYVAVSNTVIGVLLLAAGLLGALASLISVAAVLALLAVMGFAGASLCLALPEVE